MAERRLRVVCAVNVLAKRSLSLIGRCTGVVSALPTLAIEHALPRTVHASDIAADQKPDVTWTDWVTRAEFDDANEAWARAGTGCCAIQGRREAPRRPRNPRDISASSAPPSRSDPSLSVLRDFRRACRLARRGRRETTERVSEHEPSARRPPHTYARRSRASARTGRVSGLGDRSRCVHRDRRPRADPSVMKSRLIAAWAYASRAPAHRGEKRLIGVEVVLVSSSSAAVASRRRAACSSGSSGSAW